VLFRSRVPEYVRTRVREAGKNSAARITELEKQLKEPFLMWSAADYQADQNWQLVKAMTAENARLREALTFYADRHSWRSVTVPMCGCVGESSATNDSGERARRSL